MPVQILHPCFTSEGISETAKRVTEIISQFLAKVISCNCINSSSLCKETAINVSEYIKSSLAMRIAE